MESPQSEASVVNGSINLNGSETKKPVMSSSSDSFNGVLEVFVHQARDIQNICIYHKQDVYAKLSLTSDPKTSFSTKIINGGGRNPVFDDTLQFDVKNPDCSLRCEIYMMSRVKNYLEDQLLGFTLVPFSEVIVKNGKLEKEFSLSSTDLYHSPAGFLELSLSYAGDLPDVIHIPAVPAADETEELAPIEFDENEFLDPKIVCENNQMLSNYLSTTCSDSDEFASSETGFVEEEAAPTITTVSSETHDDSKQSSQGNNTGSVKDIIKNGDLEKTDDDDDVAVVKPVVAVNIEPEQKVVQQDIVDMYTKSLQQFTESLAKMKLPLDIDSQTQSENSSSSSSQQTPKSANSRVFYGSRAFF